MAARLVAARLVAARLVAARLVTASLVAARGRESLGGQPRPSRVVSLLLSICQEIRSHLSMYK